MAIQVAALSTLYKFPPGRAAFALRQVDIRAREVSAIQIAELASQCVTEVSAIMGVELRFHAGRSGLYPPMTMAKDDQVDRCLGGVAGYLDVQIRMYPSEPRALAAQRLQQALFPNGVAALTHLPYAEEHEQVNSLLKRAQDDDMIADVLALPEMADLLERLRMRNQEYGEMLRAYDGSPTREHLRDGRARCQERVVGAVSLIIGLYQLQAPDKLVERDYLLDPILEQNRALQQSRRRRRIPTDVDPQTGEELPDELGTGEPGTGEPGTGEPGTGEPQAPIFVPGEPGTGEPGTGEPQAPIFVPPTVGTAG